MTGISAFASGDALILDSTRHKGFPDGEDASPSGGVARQDARGLAKRGLERVLVASRVPELGRWWHRHQTVILAYHNILPDGQSPTGDRSLHLRREQFAAQLDRLSETHEVVRLDELSRRSGASSKPRAVITFDDAYRGSLEHGLPELTRRGMSATLFVAPGLLGDQVFWWDLLASPESGEVPGHLRDRMLTRLQGRQEKVLEEVARDAADTTLVPAHSRSATEEELLDAVRTHGVLVGSHTWGHPNLASLGEMEAMDEMERSRRWLGQRFSSYVPWLAYPYGIASRGAIRSAAGSYEGAVSLSGRLVQDTGTHEDAFWVPRVNIPANLSLSGFELRVAGLLGRRRGALRPIAQR